MKKTFDMHDMLRQYQFEMNFLQKIECSKEDTKLYRSMIKNGDMLPEGVFQYKDEITGEPTGNFYTAHDSGLSYEEKQEFILCKISANIKTIKNCILFFTVFAVLVSIVSLLLLSA